MAEPPLDATHDADAPTRQLIAASVSDRCLRCGTQLASDQRYCVNCGERRGRARFPVATALGRATEPTPPAVVAPRPPRSSSGSTLVAGIGTLLLAMGVGVLIGRENTTAAPKNASAPVQVVTVGGGASASGGPANTGMAATANTPSSSNHAPPPPVNKKIVITKKVAAAADAASGQVLGGTQNLAPPTVTSVGQPCSSGAGCENGQFTGNFFGP